MTTATPIRRIDSPRGTTLEYDQTVMAPGLITRTVQRRLYGAEGDPLGKAILALLDENARLRAENADLERRLLGKIEGDPGEQPTIGVLSKALKGKGK